LLEARRQLEAARAHLEQQRDHLSAERDAANAETARIAIELSHARSDITLLHDQRALVQAELVKITHECTALQKELERRTQQRNLLRDRVRALESSRAVRIAARIRKILRRG
jgi:chromosome segregation ATPase